MILYDFITPKKEKKKKLIAHFCNVNFNVNWISIKKSILGYEKGYACTIGNTFFIQSTAELPNLLGTSHLLRIFYCFASPDLNFL